MSMQWDIDKLCTRLQVYVDLLKEVPDGQSDLTPQELILKCKLTLLEIEKAYSN